MAPKLPRGHRYGKDTNHCTRALAADWVLEWKDGSHSGQTGLTFRQLTQRHLPPRCQPYWRGSPPGSGQIASIHHCGEPQAAKQISRETISGDNLFHRTVLGVRTAGPFLTKECKGNQILWELRRTRSVVFNLQLHSFAGTSLTESIKPLKCVLSKQSQRPH